MFHVLCCRYPANLPETTTNGVNAQDLSADKPSAVIAKAFVPTSVLRKYHCDKHDHQVGCTWLGLQ